MGTEGAEGYLMASRSMGFGTIMCTIMGVAIGANATTGAAQGGYQYGLAAGTHPLWLGLGIVIIGLLLTRKYRATKMSTVSGFYLDAYGSSTGIITALGQIFMNFVIMVSQFIAGGTVLATLLPQYFSQTGGMIVSAVIFLLIALFGGWMSCGVTNILNMIVCYVAVALAVIAVFTNSDVGGWSGIVENLGDQASTYLSPVAGYGWIVWLTYPVMMIANVAAGQSQVQCITTAKDTKTARNAFVIGGLLVAPIGYICAIIGMAALKLYPELAASGTTAQAMPKILVTLPPLAAGIAVAGMWACYVSTATNLSVSAATVFVNDIFKPIMKGQGKIESVTPKLETRLGQIGIIVFTAVACFCSFFVTSLLNFARAGLGLAIPFFIIILVTMFAPKLATKHFAAAEMIIAYVAMVLFVLIPGLKSVFVDAVWWLTFVSIVGAIIILIVDRKNPAYFQTADFQNTKGSLYEEGSPEYEHDPFRKKV
jgi:SSS family solute:Na+ symporter